MESVKLANGREFASTLYEGQAGFVDGLRADVDGNVWAGMGWVGDGCDGVHIFAPNGDRIGITGMPEIISNLVFGGTYRNRLLMTGSDRYMPST